MTAVHVATVWFDSGSGRAMERFESPHMSSHPIGDGWVQVVLVDENGSVAGVEQFRAAHRVSVRKIAAEEDQGV